MQTSNDLEFQMYEKYKEKQQVISQREKEQMQRLEMLRMMQEKEAKERLEKLIRAKEYKEQLDFQAQVKKVLNPEKRLDLQKLQNLANTLTPSPGQSSGVTLPKFTKKNPKTLCYNPITGDVKDTSQYVYGRFPRNSGENENAGFSENAHKNLEEDAKAEQKSEEKFLSGYGSLVVQNTKN
jgi:hypothetical protein